MKKKYLLLTLSLALITLIAGSYVATKKFSTYAIETAKKPLVESLEVENSSYLDLNLKDIKNKKIKISSLNKDLILIDFWATWCPPCVKEIPHFIELKEQYPNIEIIGISLDSSAKDIRSFSLINEINYPVIHASEDLMKQVERDHGVIASIPTTFIYDKNLNLIEKVVGYRDKAYFEKFIPKQ